MTESILSGLAAGYALALPIGAIAALMVSLAAHTSLRVGIAAALGIATADGLYALTAVLGGAAAAHLVEPITQPLKWLAALVLSTLAVRIAITTFRRRQESSAQAPIHPAVLTRSAGAYAGFLGMTLLNPYTIIYFTSLVLSRDDTANVTAATQCGYIAAIFTASASWFVLLAVSGAMLGRFITGHRGRVVTGLVSSLAIGALAANALLSA
ncbi:LysE family transporter [Actinomadura yumaensis]|uniref:LysE family transporter n=2 Tax=Actinomadura yumaensis TaxID=111807 RepID=A0ABW2CG66_9ACTN|nr:LysE family transporter [Actinomadura sp. J1-007]MWK39857.1 lysine transporter LysE [Actinomadura sp. J1-007]